MNLKFTVEMCFCFQSFKYGGVDNVSLYRLLFVSFHLGKKPSEPEVVLKSTFDDVVSLSGLNI